MNPLMAAVKGTSKTVSNAAETVTQAAKNAVIPPNVAYSLGMGIGPWLRNIADASGKKEDKKDAKKGEAGGLAKKEFALLSTQFNTMVTILRDIRSIGMTQLRADQQRLIESRRQDYFNKEAASESSGFLGASLTGTGKDKEGGGISSSLSVLGSMLPDILKMLLVGGAAYGIWNQVFDDASRAKIKESLFGDGAGKKGIWTIIADKYVEALKSDPVTTVIGTLIAARVTGALAAMGFAGKFLYHGGRIVGSAASATGAIMHGGSTDKTGGGRAGLQAAVEAAELQNLARQNTPTAPTAQPQSTAGMSAAEKLKYNRLMRAEVASNNAAAAAAEAAAAKATADATKQGVGLMTKLAPIVSMTGRVLSGGLLGLGAGISAFSAKEDFEQGKTWAGSLNAASATMGAGALGTMFIPGAQAVSGALAVGSALTGMAGAAMSYFENAKPNQYKGTQGPQASATQSSATEEKYGWTEEDWTKLGNVIGQRESGGLGYGAVEQKNGNYLGKYQFGTEALIDVGLMKPEAKREGSRAVRDPKNWLHGLSYEAFLTNPQIQEEAFRNYHRRNIAVLEKNNIITGSSSKSDIAGALMASQLGIGNAVNYFKGKGDFRDANGTSLAAYNEYGKSKFEGSSTTPNSYSLGAGNVTSADASSGGILGEMTQLAQDMTKLLTGGLMMASNDKNTTINQANVTGGGNPSPRIDTSQIQQTIAHVS